MLRIGIADDGSGFATDALWRAVSLLTFRIIAVDLHQLCVVDFTTKGTFDRLQVYSESIGCELDSFDQALSQIVDQYPRGNGIARTDKPARDQLRLRVNRRERPRIASMWDS